LKIFIYILILYSYQTCFGQTNSSYTLYGTINADSGIVELLPVVNISDYPKNFNFSGIPVKNGKFLIKGKISFPIEVILGFRVGGQFTYLSGRFFIEPGTQTITCNADSLRKIPQIRNATMLEYLQEYLSAEYQSIDTVEDYYRRGSLIKKYLFEYVQTHPASYVALWEISHSLNDGYNRYLDSAFIYLSDGIKSSSTGILTKEGISQLALTDTGKIFPNIDVIDLGGKSSKIFDGNIKSKYVLIDFWFSHCGPCLSEFPNYLKILEQYHGKGFAMIGISSDSSPSNIQAWKKVINSQSLRWLQYRVNKKTMRDLRITVAPYNFLLDSSGKIIAKGLGTKEVSDFLQANLN
jgi:thiol-disulfide isomerase/thioredoxin